MKTRVRKSDRVLYAAEAFMLNLLSGRFSSWHNLPLYEPPIPQISRLVLAAFQLYELEWNCHDHDIRKWVWPASELAVDRAATARRRIGTALAAQH